MFEAVEFQTMAGLGAAMCNAAKRAFREHPVLANSGVYGGLFAGAELVQQVVTRKVMVKPGEEKDLDRGSLARYLFMGSVVNANYLYQWYKWLDRKFVGRSPRTICTKLLLDQCVMSPPLYFMFYVGMSILEGKKDIFAECRQKYLKTLGLSYLFWVPAQIVNFVFLPNAKRLLYLGGCSFAWVNILCWLKRAVSARPQPAQS